MPKILVVDDSMVIRKMVNKTLVESGHEVSQAENGQEAFEIFQDNEFDLIITDINMPILNGFGLIEKVRGSEKNRSDLPIIVLSTEFSEEIKNKGKELGVNAWMVKPTEDNKLNHAVNVLIERYKA